MDLYSCNEANFDDFLNTFYASKRTEIKELKEKFNEILSSNWNMNTHIKY